MESENRSLEHIPTACPEGWLTQANRPGLCLWAGLMAGGLSALLAGIVGYLPSGRQLNDPLPLALSLGSILRGFLYFNWANFLTPLLYSLWLGLASWAALRLLAGARGRHALPDEAGRASRAAVLASALPVWVREVDAVQVFLWYGVSTWLSLLLAGFVARRAARLLEKK